MVDNKMNFRVHLATATKKANHMLGVIKRTYKTDDANTMATLYKAMVRHYLEYGNAIWGPCYMGPCYMGDLKLVEGVQRRATKLISELYNMPYEDRLRKLNLTSMEYRRMRGDMIQCFKIMNGLVPLTATELFAPIPAGSIRGHNERVLRQRAHKSVRAKSFSQRTISSWNTLQKEVIEAPSVNTFKNRLDTAWEEKWYKTSAV